MTPNPYVRETGRVLDIDDRPLPVGVDYDTVTIGPPSSQWVLTPSQFDELMTELTEAARQAAQNSARMAEESRP